jgi:hypothetical protein
MILNKRYSSAFLVIHSVKRGTRNGILQGLIFHFSYNFKALSYIIILVNRIGLKVKVIYLRFYFRAFLISVD